VNPLLLVLAITQTGDAAQAVAVPPSAVPGSAATAPIIVTARPLDGLRHDMEACLARRCAAPEDIRATLAYAEGLFVAGDYADARHVLYTALDRNHAAAADHPAEVAGLYRAFSNLAPHLGEVEDYRRGVNRTAATLKNGAGIGLAERLAARLEAGDMQLSTGQPDYALKTYTAVARDARKTGQMRVLGYAEMRRAKMLYAFGRTREGRAAYTSLIDMPGDDMAAFRLGARLELHQQDHGGAKPDLALLATDPGALPRDGSQILIWSPPPQEAEFTQQDVDRRSDRVPASRGTDPSQIGRSFIGKWVDVGFHVEPDGSVGDVRILRSGGDAPAPWMDHELTRIAGRLYSPLAPGLAPRAPYRIERFTYTARYRSRSDGRAMIASRLRGRDGIPRIERLDLTPIAGPPDIAAGS
jgi:tetratricopeptide (TPR) repeat protein